MSVIAGAAAVPHALNVLPTAAAAAALCGLVIAEIAGLPGVLLPGGTMTLLAGALIGSGRPALAVAVPVAAAVIGGGPPGPPPRPAGVRRWAPAPPPPDRGRPPAGAGLARGGARARG